MINVNPNVYTSIIIPSKNFNVQVEAKFLNGKLYISAESTSELLGFYNDKTKKVNWKKFNKQFKECIKYNRPVVEDILSFYNGSNRKNIKNKDRKQLPDFIPLDIIWEMRDKSNFEQCDDIYTLHEYELELQKTNLYNYLKPTI